MINYTSDKLIISICESLLKIPYKIHFFFGAPGWSDVNYKGSIYPHKTSSNKIPNVPGIFSIPLNPILEMSKNLNNKNIILIFMMLFSSSNNGIENKATY